MPTLGNGWQRDTLNSEITPGRIGGGRIGGGTLVTARWAAIIGQTAAVFTAHFILNLNLPILPCLIWIAASVAVNIYAGLKDTKSNISGRRAAVYLGFDIIQLSALLYWTGGLGNPFFILLLGPVAIGSTLLSLKDSVFLVLLSLVSVLLLAHFNIHLNLPASTANSPHSLFLMGGVIAFGITSAFAAFYGWRLANETRLSQQTRNAALETLSERRYLNALGAQAAAAAHELGSPLSTIAVIARELAHQVDPASPLYPDIEIILSQMERCQKILQKFGRAPLENTEGAIDFVSLLRRITGDFQYENLAVVADITPHLEIPLLVRADSALSHALGVYIQNAFQFAKAKVAITCLITEGFLKITIADDGKGFAADFLDQAGKPFLQKRGDNHKGLGIYLAQNLLQEFDARIDYINNSGAIVVIHIPLAKIA